MIFHHLDQIPTKYLHLTKTQLQQASTIDSYIRDNRFKSSSSFLQHIVSLTTEEQAHYADLYIKIGWLIIPGLQQEIIEYFDKCMQESYTPSIYFTVSFISNVAYVSIVAQDSTIQQRLHSYLSLIKEYVFNQKVQQIRNMSKKDTSIEGCVLQ